VDRWAEPSAITSPTSSPFPTCAERWQAVHGSLPRTADLDRLFAEFLPLQLQTLTARATLIPGVLEMIG
jgi:phosphonoacetaldehyde hydrolase